MDWLLSTAPVSATLLGFLAATCAAGMGGVMFRPGAWYRTLAKPAWTPPDRLFPVAWTLLYVAMAVAAWRVSLAPSVWVQPALALWACQLVLNALWSPVVFGVRRLGAGLAVIGVLWVVLAVTTALFVWISVFAGALMLPYLLWVSYAAALNLALWRRNG